MSFNDYDDIQVTLALILSNQALMMAAMAESIENKGIVSCLEKAGEIALQEARKIEQNIRKSHGFQQPVQ
jgi:hypothetical protein